MFEQFFTTTHSLGAASTFCQTRQVVLLQGPLTPCGTTISCDMVSWCIHGDWGNSLAWCIAEALSLPEAHTLGQTLLLLHTFDRSLLVMLNPSRGAAPKNWITYEGVMLPYPMQDSLIIFCACNQHSVWVHSCSNSTPYQTSQWNEILHGITQVSLNLAHAPSLAEGHLDY